MMSASRWSGTERRCGSLVWTVSSFVTVPLHHACGSKRTLISPSPPGETCWGNCGDRQPQETSTFTIVSGCFPALWNGNRRSEEHTSELQSLTNLVCRLLLEKKKIKP